MDLESRVWCTALGHKNNRINGIIKIANAERKGEMFLSQLSSLVDRKIVAGVRGRGLMFAVDLASEQVGDEIYDELIEKGYIVCNRGSLFRIDPPLTINEDEFGEFVDALCRHNSLEEERH